MIMLTRTGEENTTELSVDLKLYRQLEPALQLRTFTSYLSSRYHVDLDRIAHIDRILFLKFLEYSRGKFLNEHFELPLRLFSSLEHKSRLTIVLKSEFDRFSPSLTPWIDRFLEQFQSVVNREHDRFAEKFEILQLTHRVDLERISINHRRHLKEISDQIEAIDEVSQLDASEQETRHRTAIFNETYRSLENSIQVQTKLQDQLNELQKRFRIIQKSFAPGRSKHRSFQHLRRTCQQHELTVQMSRRHEQLLMKQIRQIEARQRPFPETSLPLARFNRVKCVSLKKQSNSHRIRRLVVQADHTINALSCQLQKANRLMKYFYLCRRYDARCQVESFQPSAHLSIDQCLSRFNHRVAQIEFENHTFKHEQKKLKEDQRQLKDLLQRRINCCFSRQQ